MTSMSVRSKNDYDWKWISYNDPLDDDVNEDEDEKMNKYNIHDKLNRQFTSKKVINRCLVWQTFSISHLNIDSIHLQSFRSTKGKLLKISKFIKFFNIFYLFLFYYKFCFHRINTDERSQTKLKYFQVYREKSPHLKHLHSVGSFKRKSIDDISSNKRIPSGL